jgi:hypothetical protein
VNHRYNGFVEAWRTLNQRVADEMKDGVGDIKLPRIIARKANPAKVMIGWMARRVLRGEFKKGKRA